MTQTRLYSTQTRKNRNVFISCEILSALDMNKGGSMYSYGCQLILLIYIYIYIYIYNSFFGYLKKIIIPKVLNII